MKEAEREDMGDVFAHLEQLAPGPGEGPPPTTQAFARLQRRLPARSAPWWQRLLGSGNRPLPRLAPALAAILILLAAFSLPPVRAAASDFLGLFRAQKFAPISVSPEQLALLEAIAAGDMQPGELTVITQPEARRADSLATAAAVTDLRLRLPAGMPPPDEVYTLDAGAAQLTVDLAGARDILTAADVDPLLLPDSLDGAQVQVNTYAGVTLLWLADVQLDTGQANIALSLSQLPVPEVTYPDDVDLTILGQALLQVLGLDEAEAARLAATIDWTSTVLLPVPSDAATFTEVRVDGVSGLALSSLEGNNQALLWQKDGVVYVLEGQGELSALVAVADSLE